MGLCCNTLFAYLDIFLDIYKTTNLNTTNTTFNQLYLYPSVSIVQRNVLSLYLALSNLPRVQKTSSIYGREPTDALMSQVGQRYYR